MSVRNYILQRDLSSCMIVCILIFAAAQLGSSAAAAGKRVCPITMHAASLWLRGRNERIDGVHVAWSKSCVDA